MAGQIPQNFIDELLTRTDIVDIIDARVPLKKNGANYKACCPFHDEKTPSFTVSQDKQFYHCFGCGAHGTAIGFLMEYDRLDFVAAIEVLAKHLGVDVPRNESPDQAQKRKQALSLYDLLENASKHYQLSLKGAKNAQAYLDRRGVSTEIATQYGIGYVPDEWDFILSRLGKKPSDQAKLESAGLVIKKEDSGRCYDRFRGRIMFPIRDPRGKYIGFGGRVLDTGEPKYLNSPETELFHKGKELYGLFEARQYNKDLDQVIVVEGYMDVVMLAQYGITCAVASLGTACTSEHIRRLFRMVDKITFCFDGDRAGKEAAWRALNNALPELQDDKEIRFLFLPDGEDPDSMVQSEGKEAFLNRVETALPFSEYFITYFENQVNTQHVEGFSRLAAKAAPLLERIEAPSFKNLLMAEMARRAKTSVAVLFPTQAQPPATTQNQHHEIATNKPAQAPVFQVHINITRFLIMALLKQPSLAHTLTNAEIDYADTLDNDGVHFIVDVLDLLKDHPDLSTQALLERFKGTRFEAPLFQLIATSEEQLQTRDDEILATEFQDAFENLIKKAKIWRKKCISLKPLSTLTEEERRFLATPID